MTQQMGGLLASAANDQIAADHQRIRQLTSRLRASADVGAALDCAVQLQAMLVDHFAVEELPGGFFDSELEQSPRHETRLGRLRDEHGLMLDEFEALIVRGRKSLAEAGAILNDARAIAHRLEVHEAAEDDVLLDTFDTDLGETG